MWASPAWVLCRLILTQNNDQNTNTPGVSGNVIYGHRHDSTYTYNELYDVIVDVVVPAANTTSPDKSLFTEPEANPRWCAAYFDAWTCSNLYCDANWILI